MITDLKEFRNKIMVFGKQYGFHIIDFNLYVEYGNLVFDIDLYTKINDEINIKIKNPKDINEILERFDKIFKKGEE